MKNKTSNTLKRTFSLIFAFLTIFNSIAFLGLFTSAAESNKKSISSVSLDTTGENLYRFRIRDPIYVGYSKERSI